MLQIIKATALQMGIPPDQVRHNFDFNSCYCNCPDGPCEHDWTGWREFKGGGERFCTACGMGAMSHTLRTEDY